MLTEKLAWLHLAYLFSIKKTEVQGFNLWNGICGALSDLYYTYSLIEESVKESMEVKIFIDLKGMAWFTPHSFLNPNFYKVRVEYCKKKASEL